MSRPLLQVNNNQTANSQYIRKHRPDYVLIVLATILLGAGLVVMYSISPALAAQGGDVSDNYFVGRQFVAIVMGILAFFVVSKISMNFWQRAQKPLLAIAFVLSLATIAFGGIANRWIQVGFLSFQPVELVKFVLIVVLAGFFADLVQRGKLTDIKALRPLFVIGALFAFVVVILQRDLGSAVVLAVISAVMAFVAGFPMKRLLLIVLAGFVLVGLAISSTPYRRDRLMTFMNPERDCANVGYHACQALIAVGSGGVVGLGLGKSIQAYGYLPEAENDSIFAIFAEKFGFIGVVALISVLGALLIRILNIMQRAPNLQTQLICVGVFTWLGVQSFINIAAMVGLLPLKGITLPFVSYGGTSLIFAMAALGLVFHISAYTSIRKANFTSSNERANSEDNSHWRRNGRPRYTVTRRSI